MDAFREIDEDGSGEVDLRELGKGLTKTLKLPLSKTDLKYIFDDLDEDRSNSVSLKEFVKAANRHRKALGGKAAPRRAVRTAASGPAPKVGLMGGGGKRWMEQIHESAVASSRKGSGAKVLTRDQIKKAQISARIPRKVRAADYAKTFIEF